MTSIALPKKVDFAPGEQPNQGIITVEPCYPGFGTTIGNALRRVLLSSLPGAAVIGVKIKGASHEFMAIPHIKEDVLEIMLNLKLLRIKVHTDEVVRLELDVHGEKEVTAGDIKPNSEVEIVNKDLAIAHITDMAGNLQMEIFVCRGKGYETVESREKKVNEIGYIEIDSIFSPVLNVGINLDNVRVGKMTNWEKLTLDVITDGTILPQDAFQEAVAILIEQFQSLAYTEDEEETEEMSEEDEEGMIEAAEESEEEDEDEDDDGEPKKKRGRPKKG